MARKDKKPRSGSQDALYESRLEVGLTMTQWRAVRASTISANQSGDEDYDFVPKFTSHIDGLLGEKRRGNYELGAPNIIVVGTVNRWILIANAALKFGDFDAKDGGHAITCGCSQILHSKRSEATEGE